MSATDDELLRDPIIIVGAPRSGTAILAHVLRAHPDLAYLREPRLLWKYGNDAKSDLLHPEDARPEVRAHIRGEMARFVREQGRRRLVEKTPSNALRLGFVDAVFPDARYVHIIRTGPDAVAAIHRSWLEPPRNLRVDRQRDRLRRHLREASWRQFPHYAWEAVQKVAPKRLRGVVGRPPWGPRLPGLDGLVRDLDLLEVCALQWKMCVEAATQFGRGLPPGRYMECRLEDLDPPAIHRILDFVGLDAHPDVLAALAEEYDDSKIIARSKDLPAHDVERIMTWIAPTLRWLDAPVDSPVDSPVDQ
jgi:hypothetical protein